MNGFPFWIWFSFEMVLDCLMYFSTAVWRCPILQVYIFLIFHVLHFLANSYVSELANCKFLILSLYTFWYVATSHLFFISFKHGGNDQSCCQCLIFIGYNKTFGFLERKICDIFHTVDGAMYIFYGSGCYPLFFGCTLCVVRWPFFCPCEDQLWSFSRMKCCTFLHA